MAPKTRCPVCPDGHWVTTEVFRDGPTPSIVFLVVSGGFDNANDALDDDVLIEAACAFPGVRPLAAQHFCSCKSGVHR